MYLREGFAKNSCCYFGFCPNEGVEATQIFCHFFTSAFLAVQDTSIGDLVKAPGRFSILFKGFGTDLSSELLPVSV